MSITKEFLRAAEEVKLLSSSPSNEDKLKLYGLYKQANNGNCTGSRPGYFYPVEQKKWDAWNKNKGLSEADAQVQYIALVESLKSKQ